MFHSERRDAHTLSLGRSWRAAPRRLRDRCVVRRGLIESSLGADASLAPQGALDFRGNRVLAHTSRQPCWLSGLEACTCAPRHP